MDFKKYRLIKPFTIKVDKEKIWDLKDKREEKLNKE